ncbi:peptide chain release factor N(5)-glutamine methyltransferase [Flavobacterium sp.]|uniref:peptide chain release factor N(5)-glutamine methyltransferase n=1 Tax=Flavobacterium sp. TaxID=239 RepID=UPI0011FFA6A1|nr:peptide chain release factor N(5)-glutamine methyltransferase [Flavobacterium sp.]RZJ73624.1 MAG: peptide chain release factor N(5)-glutamine methyltransferase [Flavobacterium sp.]
MEIKQLREAFLRELTPVYDAIEAESFFYLLSEAYLSMKRIDVAMHPTKEIPKAEIDRFESAKEKLKAQIPIQYIIGKAYFYSLEFEVNENVLIPRPETEELVDWIKTDFEFKGNPEILDIGTGSGCIAVSLARNLPDAKVSAIDVSDKALEMAKRNADTNQVAVNFVRRDILETSSLDRKYDVIVSNPPYVRHLEKEEMRKNVLEHEPHLALFVENDDALIFYRKIAELAFENLNQDGTLYFEINQYLGSETVQMLESKGFSKVELRKDLFGNDRMIKAQK